MDDRLFMFDALWDVLGWFKMVSGWFGMILGDYELILGYFELIPGDSELILGDSELIWSGFEYVKIWLNDRQIGQISELVDMRKWDVLAWESDEMVDTNHFWVSTFCPSLT